MNRTIIYVDNFLTSHGQTPTTGSTLVKLFRSEGYNVIATSNKKNKLLRLSGMVSTIISNRKNSIALLAVYSTSAFYFAWLCSLVCKALKVPYVACLHGGNLPQRIKHSPSRSATIFSNSHMNVAVSGYLQKSMEEHYWKSVQIPNNIELDAYPFKYRTSAQPRLLWVRSFHNIYNPALAIRVVAGLVKTFPHVHLTMIGPDKDGSLEACKTLANEFNISNNISFTGLLPVKEWVKLAADHDIFLNTTNFDNAPVSVVEAMALGLIVISTNVGGLPYIIKHMKNGILVPPSDATAFTEAIETVCKVSELSASLSNEARHTATAYDWRNIKGQWQDLFNSISSTNN
jgi:glycosyltransferase involved in cell wall biosynthesis